MQVGSILGSNLGLCWRLFRVFLLLESRSYLEVVSASIFLRFRHPVGEQKQSFLVVNDNFVHIGLFNLDTFLGPKLDPNPLPKWFQNRAQEAPKLDPKRSRNFKQLRSGF